MMYREYSNKIGIKERSNAMKKDNNIGLYIGLLLVLGGIVCFLDLNGLLPGELFSQYINLIIGVVILVAYFRNKKLSILMVASFFILNGILLVIDKFIYGWNYMAGVFLIPGIMLLIAFLVKKFIAYLVPGALLTAWGIFVLLITAGVFNGFTMTVGMGFLFTALGFLIIFLYEQEAWAGIPSLILGIIGAMMITLGLGEVSRLILFNVTAIIVVLIGLILIVRSFIKPKAHSNDEEED